MNLEGKAKEDFENWYIEKMENVSKENAILIDVRLRNFNKLHESMQYGVIVDFKNANDYYPVIIPNWKNGIKSFRVGFHVVEDSKIKSFFLRPDKDSALFTEFNTYKEARAASIEKFNELYNASHE